MLKSFKLEVLWLVFYVCNQPIVISVIAIILITDALMMLNVKLCLPFALKKQNQGERNKESILLTVEYEFY
jgi:hypothetical protein